MSDPNGEAPPSTPSRQAVCTVRCGTVTLRLTLSSKLLSRPFATSVVSPFIKAYNKKQGTSIAPADLDGIKIDGCTLVSDTLVIAGSLLPHAAHQVQLILPNERSADGTTAVPTAAEPTPSGDLVARVLAAVHEFAVLELPVAPASATAVRRAYRKVSLAVHPDKVEHPKAAEAFRRAFDAMKTLIDERAQAAAIRRIEQGSGFGDGGSDGGSDVPAEARWWDGASVQEMEQAFRNLEEYLEAAGALGADRSDLEDQLWVDPEEAERLRAGGAAFFVDSRDVGDYQVSHVKDALSLPGHTTSQLQSLLRHPTVLALHGSPSSLIIVYSDNGSRISRCSNVSAVLRHATLPERVRRLRGGLNGWKRLKLPVDGDSRPMFAGRPADPALADMAAMQLR